MRVRVKLIATYIKLLPPGTPGNTIEIDVPAGSTVADVMRRFDVPMDDTSVIVVNGYTVALDTLLAEDDMVTAFSAVAGG